MTIKEFFKEFWSVLPKKTAKPSLKLVFTPFFTGKEEKGAAFFWNQIVPNILWLIFAIIMCICIVLRFKTYELGVRCSILVLVLMALAFCGLVIQMIRPVLHLRPGKKKSMQLDNRHHPFISKKYLKLWDNLMAKEYERKQEKFDTNFLKAIIEELYYSRTLKEELTSKEVLAEWIVNRYTSICKSKYTGKVIMKAEPVEGNMFEAQKLVEKLKERCQKECRINK